MKFSDRYKNQLDNINPDEYIKAKTLRKMAEKSEKNQKVPSKIRVRAYFGMAASVMLCVIILFSSGILTNHNGVNVGTTSNNNGETTAEVDTSSNNKYIKTNTDYSDIYDKIKDFKTSQSGIWKAELGDGSLYVENDTFEDANTMGTNDTDSNGGSANTTDGSSTEHSDTTIQVEGVDEADIVKTDGKYIYILSYIKNSGKKTVKIVDVTGKKPKQLTNIENIGIYCTDMYLSGDRLVLIGSSTNDYTTEDVVSLSEQCATVIYDVSDPNNPKELIRLNQSGDYYESRLIGGKLYIISNFGINTSAIEKNDTATYVPSVNCKDYDGVVGADSLHFYDNCEYPTYTVICGYDIKDGSLCGTQSVLGGSYTVYASTKNIITCGYADSDGLTQITRFSTNNGKVDFKAKGSIKGSLLNQFSIDEYKGYFRFVLTDYNRKEIYDETSKGVVSKDLTDSSETNSLVILDGNLKETGKITDLAPGEIVYSVRFMGDTAFFVTFRQVDPLFSADVSDPKNPKIIGSLKIPGFSNYLFPYGDKLLGIGKNADEQTGKTGSMKLSMFDISDPANVTESSKTDVPAMYSEALDNHKATIADFEKNIIGFQVYNDTGEEYLVYSYEKGKFVQKLRAKFDMNRYQDFRGLYIGDVFYIAATHELRYYDLETFEPLGTLQLQD